jgi:hypothetical protein
MLLMDGTFDQLSSRIDATMHGSGTHAMNKFVTPFHSWFPTKVTMPLASSTDLVMAGIQDIIQALQNPTANSPLAPCTDSQVKALQDLTSLLTGIVKQDNHDAPTLRVEGGCPSNIE